MSQLLKVQYEKNNATFVDGIEAYNDKNSLCSAELALAITAGNDAALADGVLLEPISYSWDQETFTLSVNKHVTNDETYETIRVDFGYDSVAAQADAELAGWTYLGTIITNIE